MARRLNVLDDTQLLLRLDESGGGTAIDLSKNGLNGTATGTSAVAVSDMPFSIARRFVGTSSDRVVIAADAALNVASITIMGWIKPTTTGALQYIAQRYDAQGYGVLQGPSDELFFIMRDSGNVYRDVSSSISAKIGQWFHFAATFDQTIMRLYIDGVEVNNFTPTSGGIYYSGNLPFYVGCNQGATDNFLTADTADIAVVGRALAPWEIFNIYKAVRDPQVGFEVDADTICAYNFNNVSEGAVVYDDAGNHNGSVVGSVSLINGPISAKARDCSGVDGNVMSVANAAEFTMVSPKTWEIWLTIDVNNDGNHRYIWTKSNPADNSQNSWWFGLHYINFDFAFTINGDSNVITMQSGIVPVVEAIYYLAATWDPTTKTASLYVNGTFRASDTNVSANPANMNFVSPFYMPGVWLPQGSTDYSADCKIHAARISSAIRTPKEIYDYYNGSNVQGVE